MGPIILGIILIGMIVYGILTFRNSKVNDQGPGQSGQDPDGGPQTPDDIYDN